MASNDLSPFFSPHGVALIGASANPNKLSNGILRNLTQDGYDGAVYPVNPRYPEILGLACYDDIANVPDPVDLAVVILPAPATPKVLEACGKRGVKAVTLISGGFREVGAEGAVLEQACVAIARRYGFRLLGPNCVGSMDLHAGLNTTFIRGVPEPGHIGFLSQSGAVGGGIIDYVRGKGVGFSNFVSLGNEADVTETDVIRYLADDPNTRVIAAYLEGIKDGRRFMDVAREVARRKPIVVLKVGRTDAGARAVASHTGSLAGSRAAYESAFRQSGVLATGTVSELFDVALALAFQPVPAGDRMAIVTNSGGPAVLAADGLSDRGLRMEALSPGTVSTLRDLLAPSAQVGNPVDMLGGADVAEYRGALQALLADDAVDAALTILVPQALLDPAAIARAIGDVAAGSSKPVLACFMGDASLGEARRALHARRVPMYTFPESMSQALGAMSRYARWLAQPPEPLPVLSGLDTEGARQALARAGTRRTLGEAEVRALLEAYGIPIVLGRVARSAAEAVGVAEDLGYPVVLKVVSPDVLHKSDAGGICLNVADGAAVAVAYEHIVDRVTSGVPGARVEGVLVEAMVSQGHEVIVGMRRDPQFGPLMMFGLGGIYVELLTDVSFAVAPLSWRDARDMIRRTRAGRLLAGLRGQAPGDVEAVVDAILRLGQLALDLPEIDEIEINPLLVRADGVLALDARAVLSPEP